ncbi:carboxypeptidase regulatory-like domain-containing protein [Glycomyces niveus]|uniref:carboxypeptidase regulatory-like domain-containing protein n=1 Tax=Glycomyces niveus TaxID=2820287 RepID=UPI001FB9F2C5|nr:carboxypeptidase regulatory-like domain-containing protein [Glycomyces sp. NEAU-S30]
MTVAAEPSGTQTNVPRSRRGRRGGLRARLAGLAAAGGVLLGILAFPQAAAAQDVAGWFNGAFNPNPVSIGGQATVVSFTVMNNNPVQPKDITLKASLDGLNDYVSAVDNDGGGGYCTREDGDKVKCAAVEPGGQRTVTFSVVTATESDLPSGEQASGNFTVDFEGQTQSSGLSIVGTATVANVSSIKGEVTSNAEPVPDAELELTDGEGETHETTTDDEGMYEFTGDSSNPIAPGEMTLKITAEGFEDKEEDLTVREGNNEFTLNITLSATAEETTAAAESPAPETTEASPPPADDGEGGMSGTLIFLIIIGALLVVGGIVGIFFLLRGGKDDKDDDGESFAPDTPPDHTPTAAQVGTPGVYQAGPAPGSDAPTMIHPGGLVDGAGAAPTQFGPAYGGGSDSTQVMPQGGFGAAPGMPGGQVGPDGTTILPVVKTPGGPGASDATQIMPQANLSQPPAAPPSPYGDARHSAPPSAFADPGATRPHPGPSPAGSPSPYGDLGSTRPHPAPTPPPATGSMFDPQQPGSAPRDSGYGAPSAPQDSGYGAPSAPRDQSYGPQGSPSAPQYGPGSQAYGAQGGQQGYGAPSAPRSDSYSSAPRRDPYAPQEQPPAGDFGATRPMPQYGDQPQPPAAPYGGEPNREGDDQDQRGERRNWGEWDDRPRSW